MPNYSKFEEFLNVQRDSVDLKFSEIEKIIGELPNSAFTYQEWWSNHPSHPLMKIVLKNGWKQRNLDLFLKKVQFYQNKRSTKQNTHESSKIIHSDHVKQPAKIQKDIENAITSLTIKDWTFTHVCKICPQIDSEQNIIEFLPQENYKNQNNLKLHKHGSGPFCKFSIDKKYSKKSGVYIITVNDSIRYVGECDDFLKRYGMGYGTISPRNCFEGGQSTNCRINSAILNSIKSNCIVRLYFLETNDRFLVEHNLITKLNPSWNMTSGKPSKINYI